MHTLTRSARIRLLDKIDKMARDYAPRIKNVLASLSSEFRLILIVTSEGLVIGDVQPLYRLNITCIAEDNGNRQSGSYGGGGRKCFPFFFVEKRYIPYTQKPAKEAS